jgi:hypothetical protein
MRAGWRLCHLKGVSGVCKSRGFATGASAETIHWEKRTSACKSVASIKRVLFRQFLYKGTVLRVNESVSRFTISLCFIYRFAQEPVCCLRMMPCRAPGAAVVISTAVLISFADASKADVRLCRICLRLCFVRLQVVSAQTKKDLGCRSVFHVMPGCLCRIRSASCLDSPLTLLRSIQLVLAWLIRPER